MSLALPAGMPDAIIDAHHHLWGLSAVHYPWLEARGVIRFFGDPTSIQRDYLPADFRRDWEGAPIGTSVHIQVGAAEGEEVAETRSLERMAARHGLPGGIVAAADLRTPRLGALLDSHCQASARVRGVRQIVSRRADEDARSGSAGLLDDPNFLSGLHLLQSRGLSFDLQLTPPLLGRAAELFARVPGLKVALCHAGSPWDQSEHGLAEWQLGLQALAALPNSVAKLSGFAMFDPVWTKDSIARLVQGVLDAFGPERTMWGSNFPVDRIHRGFGETLVAVAEAVPRPARQAVFRDTAVRFYDLGRT